MNNCMEFPNTVEEYMEQYKIVDTEKIYTNGIAMVPIFRMMQWFQHRPEPKKGKWIPQNHNKVNGMVSTTLYYYPKCSVCGHCADYTNFCPNCGSDMRGNPDD